MSKPTAQDFTISNDIDLPGAWNQTLEEISRVVQWDLGPPTSLSTEEQARVIAEIISSISPQKAGTERTGTARQVFGDVLSGIQVFGGFVAQGATVVFGPSQQIFNAVSFMINASQRYQSVFDDIAKLMERLSFFFERLKIQIKKEGEEKLDKDIRPSVYRVLKEFVTIVAKTYQMTHGRFRSIKLAKEVLLGKDGGVLDSLHRLEELIAEITQIQIDKIYSGMSEALRDMASLDEKLRALIEDTQQIATAVRQMGNHEKSKEDLAMVRDKLRVNRSDSPDQCWEVHSTGFLDRIEESGSWFINSPKFKDWFNWRAPIDKKLNVLCISGSEGIGKTYVCHAILEYLQAEMKKTRTDFKTNVAWYYAGRESKRSTIQKALAHIIYQLASQDPAYLRHVHTKVKDVIGSYPDDAMKMWKEFVVEYSKTKPRAAFFIVLDGLDQIDFGAQSPLPAVLQDATSKFNDPESLHLRILVCGRPTAFSEGISRIRHPIDLTPTAQREDDLRRFISRRLDSMGNFRASPSQKAADLKARIVSEMPQRVNGDYKALALKLDKIETADSSDKIERILREDVAEDVERIKQGIADLNARLDHKEVARLNEILAWLAVAKEGLNVELMTSVLSSNSDSNMFDIAGKVKERFSLLIKIDEKRSDNDNDGTLLRDATLTFASDDVERCLVEAEPNRDSFTDEEVNIVQDVVRIHFQRTFGENSKLYDKFEFAKFFQGKRNIHANLIHLDSNREKNNLRVLRSCLDALCDPKAPEQRVALYEYACLYFDEHLVDIGLNNVEPDVKKQLGNRLIRVLCDETVIDSYITKKPMWGLVYWVNPYDQFCVKARDWLKDEDVRIGIFETTTERSGLDELTTTGVSNIKVLTYIAHRILRLWLSAEKVDFDTFDWLRRYWKRMEGFDDDEMWSLWKIPTIKEVREWEYWAKNFYTSNDAQFLDTPRCALQIARTYQMLGEEFGQKKLLRHAESLCQAELQQGSPMWQFRVMLAQMLRARGDNTACLEALEPIFADNTELLATPGSSQVYWTVVLPLAGACHAELKDMDAAIECFQKALDHAKGNKKPPANMTEIVSGTLNALLHLGRLPEALELLRILQNLMLDGQSWLDMMLGHRDSIHHHILTLSRRSKDFSTFSGFYEEALERVKKLKDSQAVRALRLHQWKLHWHCGPPECRDQALDEWQAMLDSNYEQGLYSEAWYVNSDAAKEMAHALFHNALKSGFNSAETQQYVNRLEALKMSSGMSFGASLSRSTRITIARLYHLSGNTNQAKAILRADVRSAIRCITTDNDEQQGYQDLGLLLAIVDDDINAKAAWSMLEPSRPDLKRRTSLIDEADAPSGTSNTASSLVPLKAVEDEAAAFEDVLKEIGMTSQSMESPETSLDRYDRIKQLSLQQENGTAASQDVADDPSSNGAQSQPILFDPGNNGNSSNDDGDDSDDDDDNNNPPFTPFYFCDGRCGKQWTYADDLWMCKDCLDTHLDAVCYQKLKEGSLDVVVCDISHHHLHVPPFEAREWRRREAGTILVAGQYITSRKWINQIRAVWDLGILENIHVYRTVKRAAARFLQLKHEAEIAKGRQA